MHIVKIEDLKPGMKLARTLYSNEGQVLLFAGVDLTGTYIDRLREYKFSSLYICDPDDQPDQEILEPVQAETKAKAINIVKRTLDSAARDNIVEIDQLQSVISEMVDQILYDRQTVYNMADIRNHDDYTFAHSVNVSILALLTGSAMNFSRRKLEVLGMGAVLHDIGKIFIPSAILNKPEKLEPGEYEMMKEHTGKGYQLLLDRDFSFVVSHMAYEHHEREDGSGYPRGFNSDKIHHYAKIVAVADTFDAMTADRVYRKAIPTHLVLKELQDSAGAKFSKPVVDCFVKMIAPYPIGSVLRLGNGEIATVIKATKTECLVKIAYGPDRGKTYDLYQKPKLKVIEVI